MIVHNKYIVLDFETTSLDPKYNQPVSIGAIMIDGRKLQICENGHFYSLINIIDDENVSKYNLSKLDKKALEVNKISLEDIEGAPPLRQVWSNFVNWVHYHSPSSDEWNAPILCGHNLNYDKTILDRIRYGHLDNKIILPSKLVSKSKLKGLPNDEIAALYRELCPYSEPYKFGPNKLFHPAYTIDTAQITLCLFENFKEPHKINLSVIKNYFNYDSKHAHNALVDSFYASEILVRYLKLFRSVLQDVQFNCDGNTALDSSILENI